MNRTRPRATWPVVALAVGSPALGAGCFGRRGERRQQGAASALWRLQAGEPAFGNVSAQPLESERAVEPLQALDDRLLPETQPLVLRLGQADRDGMQTLVQQRPPALVVLQDALHDRDGATPFLLGEVRDAGQHLRRPRLAGAVV